MKNYITKIIFSFITFLPVFVWAQGAREFWFAPPEVTAKHADQPIQVRISTYDEDAIVSISIPRQGNIVLIKEKIPKNSFRSYDLTKYKEQLENTHLYLIFVFLEFHSAR